MGICHIELEAEDDKKLTESNLLNITYSDKPLETLWQILNSKYSGKAKECHDRIHKDITEDPVLIELLRQAEIGNEELYEIVIGMTEMFSPCDYYSKQKIRVDITVISERKMPVITKTRFSPILNMKMRYLPTPASCGWSVNRVIA